MNKYLKLCDLVGRAPPLLINNKKTLKTTIGAIFTIMIVITTIVTTCFFGQELFVRKNPSVNFSTAEIHHPPFLQYDEQNFEIAFGLEDSESNLFIDETVYYPIATMRKNILVNGEMEYEYTNIKLIPCTKKNFNKDIEELFSQFKSGGIEAYCFDNNQTNLTDKIGLNDYWGNDGFKMIQIKIYPCNKETMDCNEELMEKYLTTTYLSYYTIDHKVQTQNYTYPFSNSLKNYFWKVSKNNKISITQYIRWLNVFDNDNLIFTNKKEKNSFEIESNTAMTDPAAPAPTKNFISLTLQLNNDMVEYYRSYYKFQDLASQSGGIYSSIYLATTILLYFYNSNVYYQYLINNLFDIKPTGKQVNGVIRKELIKIPPPVEVEMSNQKEKKDSSTTKNKENFISSLSKTNNINDEVDSEIDKSVDRSVSPVNRKTSVIKKRRVEGLTTKTKINLNFIDQFFCIDLFRRWSFASRYNIDILYSTGKQYIMDRTNIIYIISQGFSFEMFKNILYTEEQKKIFEIIKRPMLTNWLSLDSNEMFGNNNKLKISLKKLEELLDSFENDHSEIGQKMGNVLKRNLI